MKSIQGDQSDFTKVYQPGHPAADAQGLLGLRLRSPDGTVHLVGTLRPAGTPGHEEIRHG